MTKLKIHDAPLKNVTARGANVAPVPCDPRILFELPAVCAVGDLVKCPACGNFHKITGLGQNAQFSETWKVDRR